MEDININGKAFLVTGGAGFIGSHIVQFLLDNNASFVRVIDNLSTGKKENINHLLLKYKNLEFLYDDITDYDACVRAMEKIDIVCHQAALGSIPRSVNDPLISHNANVNGFINILEAARKNNIKRFIYASSSSVYGDNNNFPKIEEYIGKQLSPYAVTKYIDELYASVYTKLYNMECVGLRYFNVFGPRQDPLGPYAAVIPKFIDSISKGISATINGNGSYSRDFTYVDNVVQANINAMITTNNECFGQVFNIGCGARITIMELYNIINNTIGENVIPIFGNKREGDIPHSLADITKAKILLNYNPRVSVADGLEKTIKTFL